MSEVRLPSYFEHAKEWGDKTSGVFPFAYDSEGKTFLVGESKISLEDFDPYVFSPDADAADTHEISFDDITEHPLMIPTISGVIGGPKLHKWASENSEQMANEAFEVMHSAFVSLSRPEALGDIPKESDPAGFMGFAAGVREEGAIVLQVFGNCACMGVSQNGLFIHEGMENGFGQYELHNADSQVQRASLYAGIGHLARLAGKE